MPTNELEERRGLLRAVHKRVQLLSKEFHDLQDATSAAGLARKRALATRLCAEFGLQVAAEDGLRALVHAGAPADPAWVALLEQRAQILERAAQIGSASLAPALFDERVLVLIEQVDRYIRAQRATGLGPGCGP